MIEGEQDGMTKAELDRIGKRWMDRIRASEEREKDWLADARKAETAFLCDKNGEASALPEFNILHSNVETIVPSIYNSTPKPDIRPRHNQKDPIAKAIADIYERAIAAQIDDNALDEEIEGSAQDAFLAGRGLVRVKFDADEVPAQFGLAVDPETGEQVEVEIAPMRLENERLIFEVVSWDDYRFGPAKRWKNRPWEAFRHCISQEDLDDITNPDYAEAYRAAGEAPTENEEQDVDVWEIWDAGKRQVLFIVADTHKVLSIEDDPLGVPGFFSVPRIVQPIQPTKSTQAVCPYTVYKTLAEELDTVTRRINAIMKGLKVRGIAAMDGSDLQDLSEAEDNELVFAGNLENLAATGGLEKAIMWWPVDTAVQVLRELYVQREQTKQAIYEITGISDIIRGQGQASETATAQQIKTQWGSLRIKKMQRLIERQVRDIFVLCAELMSKHFSHESLARMAGVELTPELRQALSMPIDHYRIDVESDSTVRADLTKGRQEMAEFLNGTATFFGTMAPIVEQAPQAAGPIVEMYASFARQFNLGKQAEDALEQFAEMAKQVAGQPRENPEAEAMKAELQMKMQEMQAKFQLEGQKLALQTQNLRLDAQNKQADLQLKAADLRLKGGQLELDENKAQFDALKAAAEIELETEQERPVKVGN